ncbi:MAG: lysylphosphatidylglycerol synthase domain-containing protein [Gammaproteobacteria bacterium]
MKPGTRRALTVARLFAVLAGLPLLVVWAAREAALSAGWHAGLAGGIALSLFSMLFFALRFGVAMRMVGIELGLVETLRIATRSLFYQWFVPFAVGGDVAKFVTLKARDHGGVAAAAGIVLDRVAGLAALVIVALTLYVALDPIDVALPRGPAVAGPTMLGAVSVLLLVLLAAVYLARRSGHLVRALGVLRRAGATLHAPAIANVLALSVLTHVSFAAAVWLGARGWGIDPGFAVVLFVLASSWTLQAVPLHLLGIGVADLAATALFVAVGLDPAQAVLVTSLQVGYRLLMAILGGAWDLLPSAAPAASGAATPPP